jgi:hypothetical protein
VCKPADDPFGRLFSLAMGYIRLLAMPAGSGAMFDLAEQARQGTRISMLNRS